MFKIVSSINIELVEGMRIIEYIDDKPVREFIFNKDTFIHPEDSSQNIRWEIVSKHI